MRRIIGAIIMALITSAGTILYPAENAMAQQTQDVLPTTSVRVATTGITVTGTTFNNHDELKFTMEADTLYLVEYFIKFTTGSTAHGIKLSVNGPASPTSVSLGWYAFTAANARVERSVSDYDTATAAGASLAGVNFAQMRGFVHNGPNEGDLVMRFAGDGAASEIHIDAGSFMRFSKVDGSELRVQW